MDFRSPTDRLAEERLVSHRSQLEPDRAWNFMVLQSVEGPSDVIAMTLLESIFGEDQNRVLIRRNVDLFDLLVEMGAFKSKKDAKKNWTKSDKDIEEGCSGFMVGKKEVPLFIWRVPEGFDRDDETGDEEKI